MTTADGKEQVTGFQMAGEILGLDGIVNDRHTCNAIALEDAEVCVMPFEHMEQLSREFTSLQHHIHKIMSREIVRDQGVMLLLGSMRAEERLAAFLLNLVQRLHARGFSQSGWLAPPSVITPTDTMTPLSSPIQPPPHSQQGGDAYSVLDDALEQAEFTRPIGAASAQRLESVLLVQGMHCAACAQRVQTLIQAQAGVEWAQVNAATKRLLVHWNPSQTRVSDWARAAHAAGYELLPMQQALGGAQRLQQLRQMQWRLWVATLCMMQIMMYAWPAYIAKPGEMTADIEQLMRWASWVLSWPVLIFSCGPVFSQAWRDSRAGRIGMDTPVALGILITFIASSLVTFDPQGPWGHEVWFDLLTMFVFFLMGGRYLEFRARDRTAGALDALMNRLPPSCQRRTASGDFDWVSARRLQVGDVVSTPVGQAFVADGTLLSSTATVDEALLTGESHPVHKVAGSPLVAGSHNLAGPVLMRIDQLGAQTRYAQIVQLMNQAATQKPRLALLADRIAAPFLVGVMVAAALAGAYWWTKDPSKAISVAVAVLIVTCPCALSLATPAAMLSSAGALARKGLLVRQLQAIENLAEIDVMVFDKTGTLTEDRLQVTQQLQRPGVDAAQALALAAQLAQGSLHPISRALVQAHGQSPSSQTTLPVGAVTQAQEVAGQGLQAHHPVQGLVRLGSAAFVNVPLPAHATQHNGPVVHLSDGQGWLATWQLSESVRPDALQAMAQLHAMGIETRLLSGDAPIAVARIGHALGIANAQASVSPEMKLQHVQQLQTQGHRVAMVGDGLNDGPVLAHAHASFAMGNAVPLVQTHADFVVQSGSLQAVVQAVQQAQRTRQVVRQNLTWAGLYNALCVPLAIMGYMPPWAAGLGILAVLGWALHSGQFDQLEQEGQRVIDQQD